MVQKLVSVQWLKNHIEDEDIILLDASANFNQESTIPRAQHFDIKNTFSDTNSSFPNTFPSIELFETESRKLGINNDSHLIVFDEKGVFTSPRVWWMYTIMGHDKVSVLDGGLPEWNRRFPKDRLPNSNSKTRGNFQAQFNPDLIKEYEDVMSNTKSTQCVIIDARSQGRFMGIDPEPRTHIQSGHIPNSINLPYTEVLRDGKYRPVTEIKAIFSSLNIPNKPIIFSCGSGISACILALAFRLISDREVSVYDGSWTEWAEKQNLLT